MHGGMAVQFTCDAEVDFVRGMIPHHAGAITMCDIVRQASFENPTNGAAAAAAAASRRRRMGHVVRVNSGTARPQARSPQRQLGHITPPPPPPRLQPPPPRSPPPWPLLDPFIRLLCEDIEAGQSTEISQMSSWLAARNLSVAPPCTESDGPPIRYDGMAMGCGNQSCASTYAFVEENMAMHHGMAIQFTCDAEVDFVRGMIPHHAGAITMCDIVRASVASLSPFVASLCNAIEVGQAGEIAAMNGWLASKGLGANTSCAPSPPPYVPPPDAPPAAPLSLSPQQPQALAVPEANQEAASNGAASATGAIVGGVAGVLVVVAAVTYFGHRALVCARKVPTVTLEAVDVTSTSSQDDAGGTTWA